MMGLKASEYLFLRNVGKRLDRRSFEALYMLTLYCVFVAGSLTCQRRVVNGTIVLRESEKPHCPTCGGT